MRKTLIRWRRHLLIGAVILLLLFLSAGCTTTFEEWSGNMANESSSTHVMPYTGEENSSELTSQQPTIGVVRHPAISGRAPAANQAGGSRNASSPGGTATPQGQSSGTLAVPTRQSGPSAPSGSSSQRP